MALASPFALDQFKELKVQESLHVIPDLGKALNNGLGLSNTKQRLTVLYGDDYHFEIANRPEGGLHVHISIPLVDSPGTRTLSAPECPIASPLAGSPSSSSAECTSRSNAWSASMSTRSMQLELTMATTGHFRATGAPSATPCSSPSARRARWRWLFTVPSGIPSMRPTSRRERSSR